jgi:VanZ family protein
MVFVIRKCAHLTEYAILALLVLRAVRKPVRNDPRPWRWSEAGWAILLVVLYASSDEIHQIFVPHREGKFADVIIDTSGGVAGLLIVWVIGRLTKHW